MKNMEQQLNELRQENVKLHQRLRETEETLSAIRNGEVDAVVVHNPDGDQIFSLKGVDHSYRILIEEMHEGAMMLSRDGLILYANMFVESILEVALEKIIGSLLHRFIVPADLPSFLAILDETNQGGRSAELRLKTSDGYLIPAHLSISRLSLEHEAFFCLAIIDLTALKRNELILIEERLCRSIVEQSAEAIIVCDNQGTIIRASSITSDLIGLNCLTMPFDEVFQLRLMPDSVATLDNGDFQTFTIQDVIKGSIYRSREAIIESAPEARNVLLSATSLRDKENAVIGCTVNLVDITERKRGDEERRRLITAIEQCVDSIVIADKDGLIQYINPGFEQVTGYAREKVIGKNPNILKSGKQDKLFYEKMWKTLAAGKPWRGHLINKKLDGTLYEEEASITPVLDESGEIVNYVAVKRDVTEQRKTEAQLKQAQKMEAIGTLAGGIAHDFNNILGAILGYAEMAQDDSAAGSILRKDIDQVVKASHRAKDLVKQILAFSRQAETERIPLQPGLIIKEALKMLRSSLPTTIDIQQDIDPKAGLIFADPTHIHQIMVNLCTNAFHAMEETGGTLTISLKKKTVSQNDLANETRVQPGDFVQLSISDTGAGIAPEIKEKIFDPYFTTKEVGKGTGMGLTIIHGIMKSYNGFVTCHSQLGEGTVFQVYLPFIADPTLLEIETAPLGLTQLGNERILFIDDEEMLAEMGKTMLERLGYRVTVETNSIEALRIIQNQPDRFDLIITDQTMPGMTGSDLARRILQIRPELPIILCTGFSNQISEEKARIYGIKGFAMKPMAKKDIASLIRKVLDK